MSAPAAQPDKVSYSVSVGYLRAFVTLLVLAHHAVLAYHPYAPPPPASLVALPRWWEAFPVVDSARWGGFAVLVGFNDIFFMSLMFFLSGLFVWNSLARKGAGSFARDRWRRLGVPFFAAVAVISPLAYSATYAQISAHPSFGGFARQWLSLGEWPSGPAWFVWVLLVFGWLAAFFFWLAPKWGESLGRLASSASRRPARFFLLVLAASAVVYIPIASAFGSMAWTGWNPFVFQTSRFLHYFVWFLAGVAVGVWGLGRGLLARDGNLARRWWLWTLRAMFAFGLATVIAMVALSAHGSPQLWEAVGGVGFVLSCAASSFCFLAVFTRFVGKRIRVFDSLTANAYGMYLIHYAFVAWLQYSLLKIALPGVAKGSLVLAGTILLSWAATAALRRIPAVGRVI
jgi:peptidoglycan/LPS O-acetylase OafA/YrhL